jgi:hypothetical protein
MSRGLDFAEQSELRERTLQAKDELIPYIQAHPEINSLLSDMVMSCLASKPVDIFAHVADHFGGNTLSAGAPAKKVANELVAQLMSAGVQSMANP